MSNSEGHPAGDDCGPVLRAVDGPDRPLVITLPVVGGTIGRTRSCDARLNHSLVSHAHVKVRPLDGGWVLRDLCSRTGTRLDSVRLDPYEAVPAHDGSLVEIGPWTFVLDLPGRSLFEEPGRKSSGSTAAETSASLLRMLRDSSPSQREAAWKQFERQYGPILAGYARQFGLAGQEIDDVTQEVFLGLHRLGPDFEYDERRGRFRGYLRAATRHAIATRHRTVMANPQGDLAELQASDDDDDSAWDYQWARGILRRALEILKRTVPTQHYVAFELYGRRGRPAQEVADELGMTAQQVRTIKARLLAQLRELVAELEC